MSSYALNRALLVFGAIGVNVSPGGATAAQDAMPRCRVRGGQEWLATRPSPLDSATIRAGDAVAKICYSRPRARGRSVYDSLAPFGKAWRTGANEPTVLELSAPAEVAGVSLAAGRYVILTVPGPTEWRVVFNSFAATDSTYDDPARVFQTARAVGQATVPAEVLSAPVESFTIGTADEGHGQHFALEWGTLRIRVPVRFP